jgi:hypothetical protein
MSTHPSHVTVAAAPAVQAHTAIIPAVQLGTPSAYYQPVTHWYQNRHWWKRNVPIIGGAAGGAAIGGLIGGGKGAIVGGAIGGTGGYLYKFTNATNIDMNTDTGIGTVTARAPRCNEGGAAAAGGIQDRLVESTYRRVLKSHRPVFNLDGVGEKPDAIQRCR